MSEKTDDHPRPKTIRIICGEERALEIVLPLVNFTAYILSVEKNGEVPSLESMKAALIPSKISLAKLMATKLEKPIEPDCLSILKIEIVLVGGYFKLETHLFTDLKTDNNLKIVECYSVILQNLNGATLMDCLISKRKSELGRDLTQEDIAELCSKTTIM